MKVAIVPELSDVYFRHVPNTLEVLQAEVGGYIETVRLTTELLLIINEEGRLMDMPENQHLKGIVGPAVIVHNRAGDPEFHGLSDDEITDLETIFGHKETAAAAPTTTTEHKKNIHLHDTIICDKSQIRRCGDAYELDGKRYVVCLVPEEVLE